MPSCENKGFRHKTGAVYLRAVALCAARFSRPYKRLAKALMQKITKTPRQGLETFDSEFQVRTKHPSDGICTLH